ncbi:MAG: HlyD family efflux transporter periplasmic adaptor subunit [Chloroflexota bacterium]
MSSLRKSFVVLLVLVTLLTGCQGLFGRAVEEEPATPTPIPTPIVPEKPTYVVQRGEIVKQIEFIGRISPVEEQRLYFKTGGYVKRVLVSRGDVVRAGDLLAELENDDLLKQVSQAEVTLNSAQLRLNGAEETLQRQIAQAAWSLLIAQTNLDKAKTANEQQVAEAQRALEVAQIRLAQLQPDSVNLELLRLSWERAKNSLRSAQLERDAVKGRPGSPAHAIEQAEVSVQNAEIAVREAELRYQQALQPDATEDDVRLKQIEVERAKASLEQAQEGADPLLEIRVQQAQQEMDWLEEGVDPVLVNEVSQARLSLERLQARVDEAQLVAPIDGQVLSVSIYGGRPIDAFKEAIIVADTTAIEVSADVSSSNLVDLIEGQKATISLRAYPDQTWQGVVRRLPYPFGSGGGSERLADADESTRISMDNPPSDMQLGDLVRVVIVLEEKDDVLWIPPEAIRTFQGRQFVIVQDGERQRRVDVGIGIESQDRVEILEGLEEGMMIVGQ